MPKVENFKLANICYTKQIWLHQKDVAGKLKALEELCCNAKHEENKERKNRLPPEFHMMTFAFSYH